MDQQDMTNFSSLDELKKKLTVTDEVCEKHNVNLVSAFGREPICELCVKENTSIKVQKIVEKEVSKNEKRDSYDWLDKRSIFLDDTLKKATFDTYKTECKETKDNKDLALTIAREYYKGANYNTVLTGTPGTGKSHLSMSMLKIVNEHSDPYRKCLFISISELMRRIKDSFSNRESIYTEQNMVEMMTKADLLVIDDLGAETGAISSDKIATDFTTRVLYAIIDGRMNKPTIITTNLNSKELSKMYDRKLISRMFRGADGHVIQFKNTTDKRISVEF
ncbi:ATP-binding protein [Vagococcus lutrae]|uniref:ATP-binding protein n=1 Tax=Vagococcus lutrae TaxID=81947 RepID=UPI00288E61F2|nr:ATP-binding protein [Vagococcus lutrae]MDT2844693.1 ATP-binding protein [Vagococcus lutrae]